MNDLSTPVRVTASMVAGVVATALLAGLATANGGNAPTWQSVALVFLAAGIPIAIVFHRTLWPTERQRSEIRVAQESVETHWFERATAESFWMMTTLLMWMDLVGRVWHLVPWLAPITFLHVAGVALLSVLVNYVVARRRGI